MKRPYTVLFYALLLALCIVPVLRLAGLPDWPVELVLAACLLGAGVAAVEDHRRHLLIGAIATLVLARLAGLTFGWGTSFTEASSVGWLAIALFAAAGAVRFMFRRGARRGEQICAALSAYLLVGIFMGVLYAGIGARTPEAFLVLGVPASPGNFDLGTAIYFSFVTLATLGYGDIVPAVELTRGLAIVQAVGGQLYLAVLVASLVGVARSTSSGEPHSTARPPG
jgi:hypothetical protein